MKVVFISIITIVALLPDARAQPVNLDSLLNLAFQYRANGHFNQSIVVYRQCLSIAEKNKDSLRTGNALIGIGIVNEKEGKYAEALEYYFKALKVFSNIGNNVKVGGTLKNIGNTYRVLQPVLYWCSHFFSFAGHRPTPSPDREGTQPMK